MIFDIFKKKSPPPVELVIVQPEVKLVGPSIPPYPKWKHLVPLHPSDEEVNNACLMLFKDTAYNIVVRSELCFIDDKNGCLSVDTSHGGHTHGGILIEYTDEPVLTPESKIWDGPGTGRSWDVNGNCYYLLDQRTGKISNWESQVYPSEILRRHIKDCILKRGSLTGKLLQP